MILANRYVAMCDVLGFSDLITNHPLERVCVMYDKLMKEMEAPNLMITSMRLGTLNEEERLIGIGYTIFSDTILLWSEADDPDSIDYFFGI